MDDDDESVRLATFRRRRRIDDDDVPSVRSRCVVEGGMVDVTVTLSADPERTVEISISTCNRGGATAAD